MNTTVTVQHPAGMRYRRIVRILGALEPDGITEKEAELMDHLHRNGDVLTTEVRKAICEGMGITPDYLNNYVKKLRNKKVVVDDSLHPRYCFTVLPDGQPHILSVVFETQSE